jgi:hypothetical protein
MKRWCIAALLVASTAAIGRAQEMIMPEPPTAKQSATKTQTPLKMQFVLSRYQGDKKISSLPYMLGVLSNTGRQTSMRMGSAVPVITTVFATTNKNEPNTSAPVSSYQYRDVGTNIDCRADETTAGLYSLNITVEDSSIQADASGAAKSARDMPVFRRFNASFSMLLRDGQTMQYVSVTDPVSGEVMKIDVTLNLAK